MYTPSEPILIAGIALASWRLAHMLVHEHGPLGLFIVLRRLTGIQYDETEQAFMWPSWNPLWCVYCTSIYTAAIMIGLAFIPILASYIVIYLLAVSGIVCLLEAWHDKG